LGASKFEKIMTQEEKQLLLIDLCARFPYGVKANIPLVDGDESIYTVSFNDMKDFVEGNIIIKPYLRSLSSMTVEERFEYNGLDGYIFCDEDVIIKIDWLNAHHFDYRGLIEKGLAIEAPEGMYGENC
jgi:hypothetical protein